MQPYVDMARQFFETHQGKAILFGLSISVGLGILFAVIWFFLKKWAEKGPAAKTVPVVPSPVTETAALLATMKQPAADVSLTVLVDKLEIISGRLSNCEADLAQNRSLQREAKEIREAVLEIKHQVSEAAAHILQVENLLTTALGQATVEEPQMPPEATQGIEAPAVTDALVADTPVEPPPAEATSGEADAAVETPEPKAA